ncbi:MAG: SH3 domain-containing protein [Clostridia bacterium]|nr:SH3 domain-containing protein [Clostridia bacterium]
MKKITAAILLFLLIFGVLAATASALEHVGRISDAYKESVFYERLTAVELTGDQRRDIVNVALSQVGYHEGDSLDDLGGGNLFGKNEYTEYNFSFGDVYGDGQYSYYWCAAFVTYCARQSGIPEETIVNSVSCDKFVDQFKLEGNYINIKENPNFEPQTADLIFFLEDGAERRYASHIGIVIGTDDDYVYTVEGNTKRGIVNMRKYDFDNEYIVGYATPNYTGAKNDYDFELSSGWFIPGKYTVHCFENLYLRAGGDTKYEVLEAVPNGTTLILTEADGDWAKTIYDGKTGWVSLFYIYPEDTGTVKLTYALDTPMVETRYTYADGGFVVSDLQPAREDFDFLGWSTTEDGDVEYKSGDEIKTTVDLTLYPVWKSNTVPAVVDVDVVGTEIDNDPLALYGRMIGVTVAIAIVATAVLLFIRTEKKESDS